MDNNENIIINYSREKVLNSNLKESQLLTRLNSINGIISGDRYTQIEEVEKILSSDKFPSHNISLKEILEKKDKKFSKEYLTLNKLYISLNCYVKIFRDYDRGRLTISNNKIIVELNKKLIKLKKQTFSDISESKIKNKSTQKELPNYIVNDTIHKIITGKNIEKERSEKPKCILDINLDLVSCKFIMHKEKQKFRLLLLGDKNNKNNDDYLRSIKIIKFNCVNVDKNNFYHLCDVLNKSIILSEGYKINKFGINFYKDYFTKSSIDLLNFVKEANTGDIILFKNFSKTSRLIRKFMNSEYDHISLIIKSKENNEMRIYDCIKEKNIRLNNFIGYLLSDINIHSEKIVTRKLNINIEDMERYIHEYNPNKYELIDKYQLDNMSINEIKNKFYDILNQKIENFIEMNNKAKYGFSVCKYICRCSSKRIENQTDLTNKNRYFCSELIAAVYMYCNIMDKKYDPSSYLPKDFSDKGKIEFINGFDLGKETFIDFSY